jgi:hypothetical protein
MLLKMIDLRKFRLMHFDQHCRFTGCIPNVSKSIWGRGMTGTRAPLKILHPHRYTMARKAGNAPVDFTAHPKPKLLDQLREALRSRHYSRRTEQTYCHWVKRYIFFHNVRHPAEMAEPEMNKYLTHLAVKEPVSASTQNQALSALLFLYPYVLNREVGDLGEVIRARKPIRVPVVVTRDEVKAVINHLLGDKWLMTSLMYGASLRLLECTKTN